MRPAAKIVTILFLALAMASLLNARSLRKMAAIQSPGTQRNVSVWFSSQLVSVSSFLRVDRPRQEVKDAIGRSGDDVVDTRVSLPPPPASGSAAPHPGAERPAPGPAAQPKPKPRSNQPPERARELYTTRHPLRVWVAGDSLAQVPGTSLERLTGSSGPVDVVATESRLATGLTRPDVFNWFTRLPAAVKQLRPRVAVLSFGADDAHDYMSGLPSGRAAGPIGSASWGAEYRRRVVGVTRELNAAGVYVVWLGIPISSSPARNVRFRFIDRILSGAARADPRGATYIDAYSLFARGGQYNAYLRGANGQLVLMRAADGVHYTTTAGDLVAQTVLARLSEIFALEK
jgi:hypothetical protein